MTSGVVKLLRLYSDPVYLPYGVPHVPMLFPFWGKPPEDHADPSSGRLDHYVEKGRDFFQLTSLEEADVAVLPAAWSHYLESAERQLLANAFAARARASGKPIVVFFNSDSTEPVPLAASLVFRTSLYRSRRKSTEFALPAWSEDFVERYRDRRLVLRPKRDKPVVGFCGFAAPLLRSWVRNFARWGASVAGLRSGKLDPFAPPGHALRLKAMRALSRTAGVETNFVVRDSFFGANGGPNISSRSRKTALREEYVRNILDSDYTLCVRGAGNFSYRLYETLSCGRIPVFIDTDCVLPYQSVVDWRAHCVYVDQSEVECVGEIVADFHRILTPAAFEQMQLRCRTLWEEYISPEGFFRNFHRHLRADV